MRYLLNGQEMKACDWKTMEYYHVPSMVLMERAACGFVEAVCNAGYDMTMTGIVCGMGNNGGDGLAVARMLYQKHFPVKVFLIGEESHATKQTAEQLIMVRKYAIPVYRVTEDNFSRQLNQCTLLIDGIFGVGLSRDITGIYADVIQKMNQCTASKAAIDIPSGIDAGNGKILGCAFRADMTVTFAFCKAGLVLYPGADYAGTIRVAEIGITEESFDKKPYLYTIETDEIKSMLPVRPARSNKGTFGKVVLAVGSKGMAGAAYLAAMAAYRMGCGLVRIVTVEENRDILQTLVPEAVLTVYDSSDPEKDREKLLEAFRWGDVIGIGSGLGMSPASEYLMELVLDYSKVPVVIDGDGLNIVAKNKELLKKCDKKDVSAPSVVVTPHLGEMSRMVQLPVKEIQKNLVQTASDFAREYNLCCVLKDARTVVTCGRDRAYLNLTGNNGMGTGGSGDILMGMICSLVAQGMEIEVASAAAVNLHGCAGDKARERLGERGMMARDILESIACVIREENL